MPEKNLIVFTVFAIKKQKQKQTNILQTQNQTCLVTKTSRTSAHKGFYILAPPAHSLIHIVNEGTLWAAALQTTKLCIFCFLSGAIWEQACIFNSSALNSNQYTYPNKCNCWEKLSSQVSRVRLHSSHRRVKHKGKGWIPNPEARWDRPYIPVCSVLVQVLHRWFLFKSAPSAPSVTFLSGWEKSLGGICCRAKPTQDTQCLHEALLGS